MIRHSSKLSEQGKLIILGFAVGVLSGCAAVLLETTIAYISGFIRYEAKWASAVFPGLGMLISLLLLKYVVKDNIGHGVTKVLLAMSKNESKIKPHNTWSSMLTSAFTIGFGGSVGAEAPIVYTGAAIGSNIGRICKLSYRNITILLGCGAAGALAGIFKAPLAGVLFTIEILMFNVSMNSLLPLLVSSISATMVSYIFRGDTPIFECALTDFSMSNLPFYLLLGLSAGFFSLYFTNGTLWLEEKLAKIKNRYTKWIISAVSLALLIILFPPLYGQGYETVSSLLVGNYSFVNYDAWLVPVFFVLVLFLKIIAMTLTNAGGGVGGTFGPTLFAGALLGFIISRSLNLVGLNVPESNFVLVGMAALMASVMQAPMTAIFLIAEISGGYDLLAPLIITSTISFGVVRVFEKYSIYTKRIAQSGDLLTHSNDHSVLTLLHTKELIRDNYPKININSSLRELISLITDCNAAVMAVIDSDGIFQGMVDLGTVRKVFFDTDKYDSIKVYNLMENAPALIFEDEKMESVMDKFDKTAAWRLPVVDASHRYLGFISRSRLLTAYRNELKAITVED